MPPMTRAPRIALAVALGAATPACANVAVWGNVFSMLLTLAIFIGTLSLSREGGHSQEPLE